MRKVLLTISFLGCLLGSQAAKAQQAHEDNNVDEQTRKAKAIYKSVKKGEGEKAIEGDGDFIWGLNYNFFTGGSGSPYTRAIGMYNIREILFAKRHVQFQFLSHIDYLSGGSNAWFSRVFDAPVTKVYGTFRAGVGISFAAVVVDKHTVGVSVGPTAGILVGLMPNADVLGSNGYDFPLLFTPTWGLRTNVYLGQHFFAAVAYTVATKSTFENGPTITPLNDNFLSLSLGIRGFGEPAPTRHYPHY
jgi:hypothetical protein